MESAVLRFVCPHAQDEEVSTVEPLREIDIYLVLSQGHSELVFDI